MWILPEIGRRSERRAEPDAEMKEEQGRTQEQKQGGAG